MDVRKFEIGQRVWRYDENRRVYRRDANGRPFGSPIVSEYFREEFVVGIEKRSYLIIGSPKGGYTVSVGFAKAESTYYDDRGKSDFIWEKEHRYKIVDRVRSNMFTPVETLKAVAKLIGYEAEDQQDGGALGGEAV
jgi:hypothetical protein